MTAFPPLHWPSTREAALAAAREFAPRAGQDYALHRNEVVPGHAQVSRLAAAVRVRLISEAELTQIALEAHGDLSRCQKFVQEVQWRQYWRSWLELRPSVWDDYRRERDTARHDLTGEARALLAQIERGASGVAPMDAFARELVQTGYLHNHARMWFAGFWIHAAGLPWQLGCDFFERHLCCACPASNTLSWRWVAGLQTRGKAYLARRSNLEKYCDAAYLEPGDGLHRLEEPQPAPLAPETLPTPAAPHYELELPAGGAARGIWISEDDLAPETSLLRALNARAVAVSLLGALPESETSNGLRRRFRRDATADAARRAQEVWNAPSTEFDAPDSGVLAAQIAAWATRNELKTVVALKPFVGPSGDALPALHRALAEQGVALHLLRRAEDARLFPFASAGFFRFWEGWQKSFRQAARP